MTTFNILGRSQAGYTGEQQTLPEQASRAAASKFSGLLGEPAAAPQAGLARDEHVTTAGSSELQDWLNFTRLQAEQRVAASPAVETTPSSTAGSSNLFNAPGASSNAAVPGGGTGSLQHPPSQ